MSQSTVDWKAFLLALPGVEAETKWDNDWCACIDHKMVAVGHPVDGPLQTLCFKVDDHRFLELTDRPGVQPAPYLARAKWIRLERLDALPRSELEALLRRAHELLCAKLTKKRRVELGL